MRVDTDYNIVNAHTFILQLPLIRFSHARLDSVNQSHLCLCLVVSNCIGNITHWKLLLNTTRVVCRVYILLWFYNGIIVLCDSLLGVTCVLSVLICIERANC